MKFLSPKLKSKLLPYRDIIIFAVTLLVSNYFWKFTVHGDDAVGLVTWFGINITAPFAWMAENITNAVYWCVSLFRDTIYQADTYTLRFTSGSGTRIVWSCTPLKQIFIWICVLLATPCSELKVNPKRGRLIKIWYIPLGILLLYGFNILRIICITLFIELHPEWFEILHTYIFKYLFYGFMFGLWCIFIAIRNKKAEKSYS